RDPAAAAGPPEPAQLADGVTPEGAPKGGARFLARDVGASGRRAGVVEPPEGGTQAVRVGVADRGAGLVDDRVPGEEHPARPLLVLAHRDVVAERIGLP